MLLADLPADLPLLLFATADVPVSGARQGGCETVGLLAGCWVLLPIPVLPIPGCAHAVASSTAAPA